MDYVKEDSFIGLTSGFVSDCLWTPAIVFSNLDSLEVWPLSTGHKERGTLSFITREEIPEVVLSSYFKIRIGCSMSFGLYPFDTQVL